MRSRLFLILRIFSLPLLIFIIHVIIDFYGVYVRYESLDIPMHFLGGAAISRSYYRLFRMMQNDGHLGFVHSIILFVIVISLVALTSVIWELYEFIFDLIDNGTRQTNNLDTMVDIILGLAGGIFSYLYCKIMYAKS